MSKSFYSNIDNLHKSNLFLERQRLWKLLENAVDYPLITVYAGSGYGKTRAVYSFLREYDATTIWLQLSERDNIPTHFWENYTHIVSLVWPDVGARLREIGIPDTDEAYVKYAALRKDVLSTHGMCFTVYDDFHLLTNPATLRIFERIVNSTPSNGTVIMISRTVPQINITGMMLRDRVFTIHEETLCFTQDEIAEYFKLLELSVTRKDIRDIYDDTGGWAFAINLIGRSLLHNTKYERYALAAVKENISELIETEILQRISEPLLRFLLQLSLIDHLAASLIKTLAGDGALIQEMESLNAYIRYDYHSGAYMIHHLFLETLRQKQDMLTEDEKRRTYRAAGKWCEDNNCKTDALSYYIKSGDWDALLRIVFTFSFPTPQELAKYALERLEKAPKDLASTNSLYVSSMIKLKISLGLLDEAYALIERYTGIYEALPDSSIKNQSLARIYGFWGLLKMITCCRTDVYDFDTCFELQRKYYDKDPKMELASIANMPIGSYATLVGTNRAGAPEEFIAALSRAIPHVSYVSKGSFYGFDDLVRGELHLYRREINDAEQYFKLALEKSRSKVQYEIQNRSLLYLMLISLSRGDMNNANEMLRSMEALLERKEYTVRYESYDIARSHYYLLLGQPEQIPDWLKGEFSSYAHSAFIENYANRVKAQYRYMTRRYSELLAFLEGAWETQTLLIGKIVFKVLASLSLYKLKRYDEAISTLREAHTLAAPNRIIIPFTQYAKDMRTLTTAALKSEPCAIPRPWLEEINRKASAFAKRQSYLAAAYKSANQIDDEIALTARESEILRDLSQGFSRTEIAASRNISANTAKVAINIIYDKLNANNLADAVRIAVERKII